jgi:anti-anti-sigma regulatory factor
MLYARVDHHVLNLSIEGELDDTAAKHLVKVVRERATDETRTIAISFGGATAVRWNALCRLGRALARWRTAYGSVVVSDSRPSLRAVLAETSAWSPLTD